MRGAVGKEREEERRRRVVLAGEEAATMGRVAVLIEWSRCFFFNCMFCVKRYEKFVGIFGGLVWMKL